MGQGFESLVRHHTHATIARHPARMGRHYKTPNYRQRMSGNVSEEDGRVFLFGCEEVGPVQLESRFHFFEQELSPEAWARVRERHKLPNKMRHSCYSWGVRKGEGRKFGGPWTSPTHDMGVLYQHNRFGGHGEQELSDAYQEWERHRA